MQERDQRKRKAVEYLGSKCADCGYQTEFLTVYDFHHKEERTGKRKFLILSQLMSVGRNCKESLINVSCSVQIAIA
jgi:hypothetical protein